MSLPFKDFSATHTTLSASTDTTISFPRLVEAVRVRNWDTANRVLVKTGAIATDVDATASRVGKAGTADIPTVSVFPVRVSSIHVRSAGASEVTIEGYW